ncbi:MAG: penicillin-binding protein 1A [Alphaproteobacteria bacterium]|nr:penicillin-binding protein 1A [Alphaproteobacteria bacterium]
MRFFSAFLSVGLLAIGLGAVSAAVIFSHYSKNLPQYDYLQDYQPPNLSRIYADDGRMMAVVAAEQRMFVPIDSIPKRVIDAFLSAEDAGFYKHKGIDFVGIVRALFINLRNVGRERHPMGASTITQQVAKNMLLTNEVSLSRKIKEAILATKLEKVLSKERILEIYLNQIFLGNRSYGIAAAALNYFNKALDDLTIAEAAYLAALPKAPNNYNPTRDYDAAVARRNWVIGRMVENGFISSEEADAAAKQPLVTRSRAEHESVTANYFSEEVRRQLVDWFGEDTVTQGGLAVKTSLDPRLQEAATQALREGLIAFDRRERGWRGAVAHLDDLNDWAVRLKAVAAPKGIGAWRLAVVLKVGKTEASLGFSDGTKGRLPLSEVIWARRELTPETFGKTVRAVSDVVKAGDVVMVDAVHDDPQSKAYPEGTYTLMQIPVVQGALVALDPHTGRVFAMSGGFSTKISQFNRATQALRQPGSSFKPFVYMAALDNGFTPATLISDSPFVYEQGADLPLWKPENYDGEDLGPTPLRVGIEKSQNVMTVRLANALGMSKVVSYAKKFGIVDTMPELLSFSLGAKETTLMRLVTAYGMIVNGGKKITPSLIDRVQDRDGKTVWRADDRDCLNCRTENWQTFMTPPSIPDMREQVEDPRTAYQMVSMLQGVIQRGTGRRLKDIDFPLAGKTGTTNDSRDAWFIGFTPDLVCGVFVGYDNPIPLGSHETGASAALPIFGAFIKEAIKDKPPIPFRRPAGLRMVRVNPLTETLAQPADKDVIWEAFLPGTEPKDDRLPLVLDGSVPRLLFDSLVGNIKGASEDSTGRAKGEEEEEETFLESQEEVLQDGDQFDSLPVLVPPNKWPEALGAERIWVPFSGRIAAEDGEGEGGTEPSGLVSEERIFPFAPAKPPRTMTPSVTGTGGLY